MTGEVRWLQARAAQVGRCNDPSEPTAVLALRGHTRSELLAGTLPNWRIIWLWYKSSRMRKAKMMLGVCAFSNVLPRIAAGPPAAAVET